MEPTSRSGPLRPAKRCSGMGKFKKIAAGRQAGYGLQADCPAYKQRFFLPIRGHKLGWRDVAKQLEGRVNFHDATIVP